MAENKVTPPTPTVTAQVMEVAQSLANVMEQPQPTLGIDLDGCVDEAPIFFNILSTVWPGDVVVITFRQDRATAESDLARFGIRYTELVLVDSLEAKAQVIRDKGVLVYFDDQPEALRDIPPCVSVMLMRNGGNFDFDTRQWLLSERTGRLI